MTNNKITGQAPLIPTSLTIGKVSIDVETGKIKFLDGYKPDKTAREFWKFINSCRPDVVSKEEVKRVVEGMKKELDKNLYADVEARIKAQIENVMRNRVNKTLTDILKAIKNLK